MSAGIAGQRTPALLLGRDREIAEITAKLLEPGMRGVVILGAGGMGKTALADQVLHRLDGIVTASFIHGSPVLSRMPYGVLSPFLDAANPADMESPLAVLRTIRRYFHRVSEQGSPQPLLVVDDAHWLDEASCHVLTQLAMSGELRLLVLSRTRAPRIQELLSLARDGLLARVDLGALAPDAVHDVCVGLLGGPLLRASSALLATASGGNPLYLRALLARTRRLGQLVEGNGAWFLRREPDGLDAAVVDLVKGQLGNRTPEERETLETLALSQPLPRAVLTAVCGPAAVHALLADGLAAAGPGAAEPLRVAQPLHAEVIRSLVPAVRSSAIRSRVTAALDDDRSMDTDDETRSEAMFRRLEWALDCGDGVEDEQLLAAARMANDDGRPLLAVRFGAAVQAAPHLLAARAEIAAAYVETADYAQARVLLEGMLEPDLPTLAPDEETLTRAALAAARLCQRTGGGRGLDVLAATWCSASADLSVRNGGAQEPGPGVPAGAELLRIMGLMVRGDYSQALGRLKPYTDRPLPAAPGYDAQWAVLAHSLAAEILVSGGRISSALEHSGTAMDLIHRFGGQLHAGCGSVLVRHAQALLHGGYFAELERLLAAKLREPAHRLLAFGGTLGVFEGAVEIHQGRLREGLARLHPAVEALRAADPEMLLPYALGLAGYASTVVGDQIQTARYAKELRGLAYIGPLPLWLVGRACAAAALAGQETDGKAAADLARIAAEARAAGLLSAEKDILELCLATGDLHQADRLQEVAAAFEGGAAEALLAYAGAVASGNPDRMVAAADEAVRHRKYLLAVESIGHAIRFYGSHGNLRRQRALIQQLRRRRGELAGVTVSYLSPSLHLVRLTRREHEIVDLLLSGASTKDVAAHFTLSQRTVEGHVYRIYVKLGISRRADLEAAYRALEPGASMAP
ncbi:AAA family ATPase [Arthrobacter sp. zg-ZUI100]|uniref:LuxR family transcriptional regulator n=1 Tax=Arthrobacter jiangjiafuii TaxID=2817475 RepID=A0A975M6N6_9MICC|nr:LuxR family transcriptional regulator [Arthrobacter jiangjiafuii]MBP3037182.1 AAA family ATPase [Arthrobacter jiangjiafuii]MBP3043963.1 AAA family ATPase [Arthrobacter jiangjiafuii]QWC10958.1 LuxR family transcriptional regulator [Arthrobacter jiangjiafuii]